MRSAEYYLALNYRSSVYRDEEGDYIVEVPDLPGCVADGSTADEAFENLKGAMRSWIESRIAAGLAVPDPRGPENYSGKLIVRMPKFLHARLAQQSEAEGVSLNQYIVSLLSEASAPSQTHQTEDLRPAQAGSVFLQNPLTTQGFGLSFISGNLPPTSYHSYRTPMSVLAATEVDALFAAETWNSYNSPRRARSLSNETASSETNEKRQVRVPRPQLA